MQVTALTLTLMVQVTALTLMVQVNALTAQLDTACTGTKHGIQKPSGLGTKDKEYIEMLEMELIQAKVCPAVNDKKMIEKEREHDGESE